MTLHRKYWLRFLTQIQWIHCRRPPSQDGLLLQRRILLGLEFNRVYLPLSLVDMFHATSGVFGSPIANHLATSTQPIITMCQSETNSSNPIIFITIFSAGAYSCCAFYKPPQTVKLCWTKTNFLSQTSISWQFFVEFYRAGFHTEHRWRCLNKIEIELQR